MSAIDDRKIVARERVALYLTMPDTSLWLTVFAAVNFELIPVLCLEPMTEGDKLLPEMIIELVNMRPNATQTRYYLRYYALAHWTLRAKGIAGAEKAVAQFKTWLEAK